GWLMPRKLVRQKALAFSSMASVPVMAVSLAGGPAGSSLAHTQVGGSTLVRGRSDTDASSSVLSVQPRPMNGRALYLARSSFLQLVFVMRKPLRLVLLYCLNVPTMACMRSLALLVLSPR